MHPDSNEDNQKSAHKRLAPVVSFADDIDDIAYKRHHYRVAISGSHLDSPALQRTIYWRIRKHLREFENLLDYHDEIKTPAAKRPRGTRAILLQYPEEYIADENVRLFREDKARPFEELQNMRRQIYLRQRSNYNTMSDEDKKKHGIPTEIVASDFVCGGRFADINASGLLQFKEQVAVMQLEYKAAAEGRLLSEQERNEIRSSAVVLYSQTQNSIEKEAAASLISRRSRARDTRPDLLEDPKRDVSDCCNLSLLAATTHLKNPRSTTAKYALAGPFYEAAYGSSSGSRSQQQQQQQQQPEDGLEPMDLDAEATMTHFNVPPSQPQQQQQQQQKQSKQPPQPQQQYQAPSKKNISFSKSASLRITDEYD